MTPGQNQPDDDIKRALAALEEDIQLAHDCAETGHENDDGAVLRLRQIETTLRRVCRQAGYDVSLEGI